MKLITLINSELHAIVDDEDFERVSKYRWAAEVRPDREVIYARSSDKFRIRLHRLIMNLNKEDKGIIVDHIDRDGLNNQKVNLRIVNHTNNIQNSKKKISKVGLTPSSNFKGVHFHKGANKWRARITVNKVRISLGVFNSEIEAALAYNEAAIKYFGEFCRLNEINA